MVTGREMRRRGGEEEGSNEDCVSYFLDSPRQHEPYRVLGDRAFRSLSSSMEP